MPQLFVNSRMRVCRNTIIHIHRHFSSSDYKVNVSVGEEVVPETILGESSTSAGFRTIQLAEGLGEDPKNAPNFLKRGLGQTIYEGELLAAKDSIFGLNKKLILAPADGIIEFYDMVKGNLRLKLLPKKIKLASGVYGVVDAIDQKTGDITLRTLGDIIYGIFGTGREREGMLEVMGSGEDLISSRQITEKMSGKIIVGGGLLLADAIEKAVSFGVLGIVTGGINIGDYRKMEGGNWNILAHKWSDVGLTVMVTEGFGTAPIGKDIFMATSSYSNRFVLIDGNQSRFVLPTDSPNSMIYIRKAKLVSGASGVNNFRVGLTELKVGASVRVIGNKFLGLQGVVQAIDQTETKLPSGIKSYMVTIVTTEKRLQVPYQNLELVV